MKKLTALLLSLVLLLTAFSAFAESEEKWDGPVEQIVMAWNTPGVDNAYLDQVAQVINDYIRDKIGVEVSFRQVSVFESASAYTRWIAGGGEGVDLITIAFVPTTPFIAMNMIQPLDDYLDQAPHIVALAEEGAPIYDPNTTGHVYALSVIGKPAAGTTAGMWFFEDALREAGFDYEDGQIVTLDQIDEAVRGIKAKYPNAYVGLYGSAPRGDFATIVDPLGAGLASGALVGDLETTEVVNYFESEAYQKYIQITRGWYVDGIVLKDAATTDATDAGSMINDPENCLMMWNAGDIGLRSNYESQTGKKIVCLYTSVKYNKSISNVGGYTAIPVTAQHPEAAMRFMDMLYSDEFVYNSLMMGIEGLNYEFTNDERNAVQAIAENHYYALGLVGNMGLLWQFGEYDPELEAAYEAWAQEGFSNPTKGFGFCYDATNMTNQITAIDAVLAEYRAALETGSVDIDKVYPEFINKLKMNGIDQVIADKQAQFDEWLKNKGE